jgi:hypothetical protein
MRLERPGAIWANDAEVLDAVVRRHSVDVVEDQCHRPTVPFLSLTAELAQPRLHPFVVQPTLEVPTVVCRALFEYLGERGWIWARPPTERPFRVEVVGRDSVVGDQLPQAAMVVAGGSQPQDSKRARETHRVLDGVRKPPPRNIVASDP